MKLARPYRRAPLEIATIMAAKLVRERGTADAPSVSGVELPAVMVAPSPLPNTGLRADSFSAVESGRRLLSLETPR